MKKNTTFILSMLMLSLSPVAFSHEGWTGAHSVELIDTLDDSLTNKSLITLQGYSNSVCSNDRVQITASNAEHYSELMSVVLSAFYTEAKVNVYINADCQGSRIQLSK